MGRWRPPALVSSPYITAEGYQRLQTELKNLLERRQETTRALATAAAEGDRSENAEYIYRKKELRDLDKRIGYLQKRMPALKIVTEVGDEKRIFFGASVTIENKTGVTTRYRIVGPDEIHLKDEYISIDSPMGKALLNKAVDEEFTINIKGSKEKYLIVKINYPLKNKPNT